MPIVGLPFTTTVTSASKFVATLEPKMIVCLDGAVVRYFLKNVCWIPVPRWPSDIELTHWTLRWLVYLVFCILSLFTSLILKTSLYRIKMLINGRKVYFLNIWKFSTTLEERKSSYSEKKLFRSLVFIEILAGFRYVCRARICAALLTNLFHIKCTYTRFMETKFVLWRELINKGYGHPKIGTFF